MEVYWEINSTEIHNYQTWHLNAPVPCYMLIIESQSHWRTKNKTNIWVYLGILVTFSCKASRCDLISSLRVSCIAEPNFWISLYCMVNDEHIKEFNFSFLKLLSLNIVESWKNINAWTFFRWNTRFFRPFIYGAILKHSDPSLFDHCSKVIEISGTKYFISMAY